MVEKRLSFLVVRSTELHCLLVMQRLSITLDVRNSEMRYHWWSNGFKLYLLCETQYCVVTVGATAFN